MKIRGIGKSRRSKVFLGAGLAVLLVAIVLVNLRSRKERVLEVDVEQVARGTVLEKVKASGKVQPEIQVKLSANVSGRIERLGVKEGDHVEKAQAGRGGDGAAGHAASRQRSLARAHRSVQHRLSD